MNIIQLVNDQEQLFIPAITEGAVSWQKESQFAIQALAANDYLAQIALKNPQSAQAAIVNVAAIGISLNPALKHAYLVPRKNRVCLDISYMGLMHLAISSGSILWGQCILVHENDAFEMNALGLAPMHKYNPFGDRGELLGGYCCAKAHNGDFLVECMRIDEIYAIRKRSTSGSKGGTSPWDTDFTEMARKVIVKRASKYWPKADRLSNAIEVLNTDSMEGYEKEPAYAHVSDEQKHQAAIEDRETLESSVNELMNQMAAASDLASLKSVFAKAFRITQKHDDLNQRVIKYSQERKREIESTMNGAQQ